MDYKKMYKKALERAKFLKENTDGVGAIDVSKCFEEIFPELKESKDEKIRKVVTLIIKGIRANVFEEQGISKEDAITYLEKKGEQKSTWSEEDETALCDALCCCKQAAKLAKDENDMVKIWYAEKWLKSLKDRMKEE